MDDRSPDLLKFIESWLPRPPARLLEIGCGRGELAVSIASLGYPIIAIDPEAPEGDLFEAASLEEFADPGPFDAVIANRALHHIADLPDALDKIVRLMRPHGRLILREHAWDRLDERTARWYLQRLAAAEPEAPASLEACLSDWVEDHAGLHGYATMHEELGQRFTELHFEWTPYLHGELGGTVSEQEEQALIDAEAIEATGFRYVGEPVGDSRGS